MNSDNNLRFHIAAVDRHNAHHVGDVFRSVYGEEFPAKIVYQPEDLYKEIRDGKIMSGLAFNEDEQPAGYVSMYKAAPNPGIWEAGSIVVNPEYKHTSVSQELVYYCRNLISNVATDTDGIFMEAVCSHYYTQVNCAKTGMFDCGIELDQLDGKSFKDGKSNRAGTARVSCLFSFMETSDPVSPAYLPAVYDEIVRQVAVPLRRRRFIPSTAEIPDSVKTRIDDKYYPQAATCKIAVHEIGNDWAQAVESMVRDACERGTISLQITLNMAEPHIEKAVDILRKHGFFFGGLIPRWFESDGLLMQRLFNDEPQYEKIKLYTSTAKDLLRFIGNDRESVSQFTIAP